MMKKFIITTKDSQRVIDKEILDLGVEIVYAEYDDMPHISLCKTVVKILSENREKPVLIFEDDAKLTKDFDMKRLEDIVKRMQHFDVISTGVLNSRGETKVRVFGDGVFLENFVGNQGSVYMPSAYERIKDKLGHIDRLLSRFCMCWCVVPFMSVQKNTGDSRISGHDNMEDLYDLTNKRLHKFIRE